MRPILYLGCPPAERADASGALAAADLSVVWADSPAAAASEIQRQDIPVLLDLSRGATALQAARDLRAHRPDALIFAVVDSRRPDLTTEAVLAGIADVFARPLGGRRVANALDRERRHGGRHPSRADSSEDLYCQSPAMRDVSTLIARAATMRAGVLVKGEEGTGRQVVARAIHAAQSSNGSRFVAVDCAAHDAGELESILFGTSPRPSPSDPVGRGLECVGADSRLHEAQGGTLYLQNLADAPTRVQGRLARILRDREAQVIDKGTDAVPLDVRPIASVDTHIDSAVQEGRVREDLFRRLSVISIDLPPLRNRREDIPALANYFVREVCGRLRVPAKTLSRPALSLISALPWRGNAVELRTLLETVVVGLAGGKGIGIEDVLSHVRLDGGTAVGLGAGGTLRQARARFEREYISAVLEQHQGRISDAAKALGIQRTNLYRKLRSLRIPRGRSA